MTRSLCAVLVAVFLASACAAAQTSPSPPAGGEWREFKGYELYSWQGSAGEWRYALVPGTNRLKSWEEVAAADRGEARLKAALQRLAAGESVSWCHARLEAPPPIHLELPPTPKVQELVDLARRRQVRLEVCEHGA